jgi:ABC-type Fe3+/spermidine/putrescine transport system ATPase subunit
VASGEFFSLLGPSGCGKTTTLLSVFDNVAFGLRYAKTSKEELRTRVGAADLVSMPSFQSQPVPTGWQGAAAGAVGLHPWL